MRSDDRSFTSTPLAPELLRAQAEIERLTAALRTETIRRERAEENLRHKSSLLAATLKAYPDLHFRLAPDGTFLDYSADDATQLYRPADQMMGRRVQDIVPPDVAAQFDNLFDTLRRTGQVARMEYPLTMPNGLRYYEARLLPHDDGNLLLFVRDITERRRAEDALRASEARFRLMIDQSPLGVHIIAADGRTVLVNRTWERMWGLTLADLDGYNFLTDPKIIAQGLLPDIHRVLAGETITFPPVFYAPHAGPHAARGRWVRNVLYPVKNPTTDRVTELVLLEEDVTDQTRAESELRAVASYTRCVLWRADIERVGDWPVDFKPTSTVMIWKFTIQDEQAAQRIIPIDVRPGSTYAHAWFDSRHPDDVYPCRVRSLEAFGRGLPSYRQEFRCIDKHGRTVWLQEDVTIHPVGPDRWEAFGVCIDITDRKRAEEALRQSEQHFREAAEFNNLLLREVDHRVKNNLAGLLSLLTLAQHKASDVDAFAAAMESRLRGMSHIHQLLASSGWRSVDLRSMVTSLLAALESMARHTAHIVVDGPDVHVQARQALPLTMIVVEFFTNSCKYGAHSAATGTVSITWTVEPIKERYEAPQARNHELPPTPPSCLRAPVSPYLPPPTLLLRWTESGGPPIPQPVTPSLGSELVQNFGRRELRGTVQLQFPPAGVDHLIQIPLDKPA
jgi:PAS domain S-box-containing protein